jgi:16S rRNA C967 or C1407 C5-methylase (RsmB/RsmF family)/NOL1/NOP2/fmu family ribosome biogenesis protein
MKLPELFIKQIAPLLKDDFESFIKALSADTPVSIRINNNKMEKDNIQRETIPWCSSGFYLEKRPVFTLDPLFHAGCYYVQEAGSMFLGQAIRQTLHMDNPVVLDLCAAPGGKSTHLAELLGEKSLLVSNEIIRNRNKILQENITKWGASHVVVTNNDPSDFSGLQGFFDMIVVDAPCSGEGMFRKDPLSINEWSGEQVAFCAERQRKILANVYHSLKTEGILIYSTCTYNKKENEENIQWLMDEYGFEPVRVEIDPRWGITESEAGYRFYPHKTKGEGFFLSVLQKKEEEKPVKIKTKNKSFSGKIPEEIKKWFLKESYINVRPDGNIYAFPEGFKHERNFLEEKLHVAQAGTPVAKIKGKDIIPEASLAFSVFLNKQAFVNRELDWEEAISFLRKDNQFFPDLPKGWILMTFKGYPLGWVKNMGTRVNNHYPQEWRIRMEADKSKYTVLFY